MKHDEFSFLNLQLAGMLKSGIPLEGALRRLSTTMRRGQLRSELTQLEADLAQGISLNDALAARRLPDFYRTMVQVGVRANDLPGVLTMLADYYQRIALIGTRMRGLMVYPLIVLAASLALSIFLASFFRSFLEDLPAMFGDLMAGEIVVQGAPVLVWLPVVLLSCMTVLATVALIIPFVRRFLRWHLPGFKEASLTQLAAAMEVMLKGGSPLKDALGLLRAMESKTPAGKDVAIWQSRLAAGHRTFAEVADESRVVPPLFCWLVSSAGENLAEGFRRAAEIYRARATHRIEMALYAVLPVSILMLGLLFLGQLYPVLKLFTRIGSALEGLGP